MSVDTQYCHGSTVKMLAWSPESILKPFNVNINNKIENYNDNAIDNKIENIEETVFNSKLDVNNSINNNNISSNNDIFQKNGSIKSNFSWRIASCGEDHTVRIFEISE